ncbi:GUN4 domain-containing protein [Roseofilum reptotaenium CS-1145]|uniref:CHAT domain-containing protein n=1 Tax=Roseofilum reptotaenium AO1-A TaxID=1925591 RepID=A0A1L9QSU0_9CYAN|nr:GUN4 domain-containing protein [Roseofilum reptotaenium]MDB9519483.1 GUN4 domain-containing protein [Roseofilum reptotaenium CS-1145]OJJ25734.1 hypothetical protein BI308_09425 [Roseofilum reptotaenium AO1-A]
MAQILHIELTPVGENQARFRFFWDNPNQAQERIRPLAEIEELLEQVEKEYYTSLPTPYQKIGQRLFNWLDGGERFLQSALDKPPRNSRGRQIVLAISTSGRLANLPWEVLHNGKRFLVECRPPIVPVRWVQEHDQLRVEEDPKPRFLNLLFMASSPRNFDRVLDFEAEEGQILTATKGMAKDLRLVVEESGCLDELQELIDAESDPFDIVHLTGHATITDETPYFLTEDEYGDRRDCDSRDIADVLPYNHSPLVFLSGCQTGYSNEQTVFSMAEALVQDGVMAVLGWGNRVNDAEASAAAATLYGELSAGQTLVEALGRTYQLLLKQASLTQGETRSDKLCGKQWHLLRLYTSTLPGALVTKRNSREGRREPAPPSSVQPKFIDEQTQELPLIPRKEFVGRRRQLQNCLRVLKSPDNRKVGVMLAGMGGWGKSAIAARLCDRLSSYFPQAIIWGRKSQPIAEPSLVRKLCDQLGSAEERQELREGTEELKYRLRNVFLTTRQQPFLLVLDDFEWSLELKGEQYRLQPSAARVLEALVWAIESAGTEHRIIITCRYQFDWQGLDKFFIQPLDSFHHADLQKKLRRLEHFSSAELDEELLQRTLTLSAGNPRLLEMLNKDVLSQANAEEILTEWENHPEKWKWSIIWEGDLYPPVDNALAKIISACSIYEINVPMAALTAVCKGQLSSREDEQKQIKRAINFGLIEVSHHLKEGKREYRVSQNLSQIFPAVRLPEDTDKLYRLYQKAWAALTELWANIENKNQGQWQEIFRLKFAEKGNPERFREGFEKMRHFLSNCEADSGFQWELRKSKDKCSEETFCERLETLLQEENWYEANEETTFIFYQIMVLENKDSVRDLYIDFPSKDLEKIDRLWVKYSGEQFGFSIQKEIWLNKGGKFAGYDHGNFQKLAEYVGWRKHGSYCSYPHQFTFNKNSQRGHLPRLWGG